jgi:hypothetical protein
LGLASNYRIQFPVPSVLECKPELLLQKIQQRRQTQYFCSGAQRRLFRRLRLRKVRGRNRRVYSNECVLLGAKVDLSSRSENLELSNQPFAGSLPTPSATSPALFRFVSIASSIEVVFLLPRSSFGRTSSLAPFHLHIPFQHPFRCCEIPLGVLLVLAFSASTLPLPFLHSLPHLSPARLLTLHAAIYSLLLSSVPLHSSYSFRRTRSVIALISNSSLFPLTFFHNLVTVSPLCSHRVGPSASE